MIESVFARNFKAFQEQTINLRPITLLTGLNGSGKSSLLQILLLLRQSFEADCFNRNELNLNGSYVHLGSIQDILNESATDDRIDFGVHSQGEKIHWSLAFDSPLSRNASAQWPDQILESSLFGSGFVFLAADRVSPQIFYGVPDSELPGGRNLGIHGEWTAHFLSRFGYKDIELSGCAHEKGRSLQLAHQVEAWMGEISPGVQIHLDARDDLDLVGVTYSFIARRDVSRKFRPTNVGFGVTYALPIVTAVLASRPGDVLILESPEAHLHPQGQTKMAELFARAANSGVQLIVESHSDHVLNGLRVCIHDGIVESNKVRVLYFRWTSGSDQFGTTVKEIEIDKDGRIADWPEGFFDEFDKSLGALLRPST